MNTLDWPVPPKIDGDLYTTLYTAYGYVTVHKKSGAVVDGSPQLMRISYVDLNSADTDWLPDFAVWIHNGGLNPYYRPGDRMHPCYGM